MLIFVFCLVKLYKEKINKIELSLHYFEVNSKKRTDFKNCLVLHWLCDIDTRDKR